MKERIMRMWANPYAALDTDGNPAGCCPEDPSITESHGHVGHVGSKRHDHGKQVGTRGHQTRWPDLKHEFSEEAQVRPFSAYYCQRILCGELFAADEMTAAMAGVKFVPYASAIAAAKTKAEKEYRATYNGAAPGFLTPKPPPLPVASAPVETPKGGV